MRQFKFLATPFFVTALVCVASGSAWAQQVRIIYPQEGQDVRGEVTVRYEGLPPGGQAIIRIDDQFKEGTAQEYATFDTISDRSTFTRGDGTYKVSITVLRPGGAQVGTDSVKFNVANNKVDASGEAVKLTHWKPTDILRDSVDRYRVFAESDAVIEEPEASAGGAGGGEAGGGGAAAEADIPAPLDWQIQALMRRQVRNIGMFNGSANIATVVQESIERQRKGEGAAGGEAAAAPAPSRGKVVVAAAPTKADWADWSKASETGKYFVKMIEPNGTEINSTRKAPTISIADLLPTFPDSEVRPGSTWETNMTILGDLSTRKGINVTAPITFTAYDTILTPAGESRRCAKLESRFRLPENLSKQIAADLGSKVEANGATGGGESAAAGGTEGGGAGGRDAATGGDGAADAAPTLTPADIEVARTDVARVMWFDISRRQVLRSEDTIKSYFEIPPAAGAAGGTGAAPAAGGEAAAPAEPTKVTYNLGVTTLLDDSVPSPNVGYTGGLGTAHAKDSVNEPGITRVTRPASR